MEKVDLLEKIKKSNAKDNKVIKAVEEIKWAKVKILRDKEWWEEDRLILRDGKVYVPRCYKLHLDHNSGNTWPISMI